MDILLSFFELSGSERRDQAKNLPHQHTYITAFYVPKKEESECLLFTLSCLAFGHEMDDATLGIQ